MEVGRECVDLGRGPRTVGNPAASCAAVVQMVEHPAYRARPVVESALVRKREGVAPHCAGATELPESGQAGRRAKAEIGRDTGWERRGERGCSGATPFEADAVAFGRRNLHQAHPGPGAHELSGTRGDDDLECGSRGRIGAELGE